MSCDPCQRSGCPGGGGFVHWVAWNIELVRLIPESIAKTPTVTFPLKAVQGTNSFGEIGYNGPCPPQGQTHRYFFKMYGLDTELALPAGATKDELAAAMQGHVVQYGENYVTYRQVTCLAYRSHHEQTQDACPCCYPWLCRKPIFEDIITPFAPSLRM